ncbi:unnamed protein product [Clonostachys rhizophaga]|uniref:BTB domain-containing protein n=1 Tax=Clonostachys rhizophaga TaxID=160324 RepID=A0A9N9V6P3_9HYPO|nr:unnamed protein product [Clonostachys rhizophaga]
MASANLTEDSNKKDANVDIAVNGDVAFIVGPSCRRLRVYSLVLTNASTVFNVMLGPHFKEGHQLAQTGLTEIELPEDNAEAVEIVFNIIHGRNDRVSDTLDPDKLLQVAIITDKYDCLVPLAFAMKLWLKSVSAADPVQMWALAMVGVILRREETFAEAASALILNSSETYLSLTNINVGG